MNEEKLPGTIGFVIITAGHRHHLGIKSDGTLWAWGESVYGGMGTEVKKSTEPIQVGTDANWTNIKVGEYHSLGLKSDGTLWAWGQNWYGQLGTGNVKGGKRKTRTEKDDKASPVQIGQDTDWINITAAGDHSLALKSDGSIWGWGDNSNGQLGDRNLNNYPFDVNDDFRDGRVGPGKIGEDTDWTSVTTGLESSFAVKADGTLWASGNDISRKLGIIYGDTHYELIRVGTDANWKHVSAGNDFCLGIKSDGSIWAWGNNYAGQLGNGTTESESTPVQIRKDIDWVNISAGENCYGLKSDGSLWEWGNDRLLPLKKDILKEDPRIHLKADGGLWMQRKSIVSDSGPKNKSKTALQETANDQQIDNSKTIKTASGLEYTINEKGNGAKPKTGDKVVVHYTGRLTNKSVFDSSVKRGTPFSFKVGADQVIKGWDEAMLLLQVGDKATLKLSPELAYGERGAGHIPPNSTLIFDVELLDVIPGTQQTIEEVYIQEDDVDGDTTAYLIAGRNVAIAEDKLKEVTSVIAKWRTKTTMPLYSIVSHRGSVIGLTVKKAHADDGAPELIDKEAMIKMVEDSKKIPEGFWKEIAKVLKPESSGIKDETKLLLCAIGPLASAYLASGKLISNKDKNAKDAFFGCDMNQEPHSTGIKGKWIVRAEDWNIEEVNLPKKMDEELYLIARYD